MRKIFKASLIASLIVMSVTACGKKEKAVETYPEATLGITYTVENSTEESSSSTVEELTEIEEETFSSEEKTEYQYATLEYTDDGMILTPNGGLTDDTVIYNGKTFGEYVDFIDNEVLEKGRTINKEFLRDLLAINLVDPSFTNDFDSIAPSIMFCTTVANDLHEMDIDVHSCEIKQSSPNVFLLSLTAEGTEDIWHCDFENRTFCFNDGNTEYNSTMFDDETLNLWNFAVNDFFG